MPYSQQPRLQEQQMVRRQTAEGHVSPPKATAFASTNGSGSAGIYSGLITGTSEFLFCLFVHVSCVDAKVKFSPYR